MAAGPTRSSAPPQMAAMIRGEGHVTVETGIEPGDSAAVAVAQPLAMVLEKLYERWRVEGLPDSGRESPYTTAASTRQLIAWVMQR